jgi:hypothetical protein
MAKTINALKTMLLNLAGPKIEGRGKKMGEGGGGRGGLHISCTNYFKKPRNRGNVLGDHLGINCHNLHQETSILQEF